MSIAGKIIKNFVAPLWAAKERSPYLKHLNTIEILQNRSLDKIKKDHLEQFKRLIYHAFKNSSYYRNQLDDTINIVNNMDCIEELQFLPVLTKEDIRNNMDQMIAQNFPKYELEPRKTSGSTGISLQLFVDWKSSQWKRAVTVAYDRWTGWDIGESVGAIWGNPECYHNWRLFLRNLLLERHIPLDTLKMDKRSMKTFNCKIVKRKPAILFGHAHSLYLFARFLEEEQIPTIHPKGIISTCMVLHNFERETIERVFGCRVTNRYGCEEVSLIACECSNGNMHLNCDNLIVEFIRNGEPVPPGEPGAIVVTDLTNYGMPIIRYKVGDVGIPSKKMYCSCGCSYPIMESLEGRIADYIKTPDGKYISGISLTENFAMELLGIKQIQIIQDKIDHLIFRIVKGETFSPITLTDLDKLTQKRFGNLMKYDVSFTDSIQSESSGKYRFCISKLPTLF